MEKIKYDFKGRPICPGCGCIISFMELRAGGVCVGCGYKLSKNGGINDG